MSYDLLRNANHLTLSSLDGLRVQSHPSKAVVQGLTPKVTQFFKIFFELVEFLLDFKFGTQLILA